MATKNRWIDANALLPEIVKAQALEPDQAVAKIIMLVTQADSVDAVEVVRCKDCKYCRPLSWGEKFCARKQFDGVYVELSNLRDEDFCSYGERRTDNA